MPTQELNIIDQKIGNGAFYVAKLPDGGFMAGVGNIPVKEQNSKTAQEIYDFYRPLAHDSHAAWNICYCIEDYI